MYIFHWPLQISYLFFSSQLSYLETGPYRLHQWISLLHGFWLLMAKSPGRGMSEVREFIVSVFSCGNLKLLKKLALSTSRPFSRSQVSLKPVFVNIPLLTTSQTLILIVSSPFLLES